MKRENIFISENRTAKRVAATKFIAPGDVPAFDCLIRFGKEENDVTMQNCNIKDSAIVKCSPDDTYDFETGALIALMKMCGVEKVTKACDELYKDDNYKNALQEMTENNEKLMRENNYLKHVNSCRESAIESLENTRDLLIDKNNELISDKDKSWKNYQRKIQKKQDRINELERAYKASNDDKAKLVEYYQREIKKLKEENESLNYKYNLVKAGHDYWKSRCVLLNSRQNGKQYTLLVDLFKKLDQKKVDAAYKEAYNTKLPLWQKEVLNQMYGVYKESKDKIELPSTLDINGTVYRKSIQIKDFGEQISKLTAEEYIKQDIEFTRKCVDEWLYKIPTKREEMWAEIFALHKESDVIIKVKKEDVNTFLHELENKIPEITWYSCVKIFETKYTIGDIYEELKTCDAIYFRLHKRNKLSYTSDSHIYPYRELKPIDYLPPMRWDLFKKGRLAVKVTYNNFKEFCDACEKELGKKPSTYLWDNVAISICKKDGCFEIFTIEHQKKTGRKIVNWEDVR